MTAPNTNELLAPHDAVAQYIAGGLTTAVGMPNLYQLRALLALSAPDRLQWGRDVATEFDKQLPQPKDGSNALNATVEEIGGPLPTVPGIRVEAQVYLCELAQGFPFVGQWHWTTHDTPVIPEPPAEPVIVAAGPAPAGAPAPFVATVVSPDGNWFHHFAESVHEAITTALHWIETEAEKL